MMQDSKQLPDYVISLNIHDNEATQNKSVMEGLAQVVSYLPHAIANACPTWCLKEYEAPEVFPYTDLKMSTVINAKVCMGYRGGVTICFVNGLIDYWDGKTTHVLADFDAVTIERGGMPFPCVMETPLKYDEEELERALRSRRRMVLFIGRGDYPMREEDIRAINEAVKALRVWERPDGEYVHGVVRVTTDRRCLEHMGLRVCLTMGHADTPAAGASIYILTAEPVGVGGGDGKNKA